MMNTCLKPSLPKSEVLIFFRFQAGKSKDLTSVRYNHMSRKEELLFQFFKINLNAYALNTSIKVKLFLIKEPLLCHSIVFVHITAHFIFTRTLPISSVQHNQTSSRPLSSLFLQDL